MDFTTDFHLDTYPVISPARAELSQAGRTVLITGGSQGVGLASSRAFVKAKAKRVIILARRTETLAEAKTELEKETSSETEILTYSADITDDSSIRKVWDDLKSKDIGVDVLVLNAAVARTTPDGHTSPDLISQVMFTFELNVFSQVRMAKQFMEQGPAEGKVIVSVNASVVHISPTRSEQLAYAPSKTALGSYMQALADCVEPEKMQIISYHPGSILTEATAKSQWANAAIAWNTATLPGDFALWASSSDARFLHGRFVWCNWDVEELRAMEGFKHPGFCRIGLQGPEMISGDRLWVQMAERLKKSRQ